MKKLMRSIKDNFGLFRKQKEIQGNSIAIWSEDNEREFLANVKVDLDVNIWISKKESENYIEFGITIPKTDIKPTKFNLILFLPYLTNKDNFEDKGKFLVNNTKTLEALFNEDVAINSSSTQFTEVKLKSSKQIFYMFKPDIQSDISYAEEGSEDCLGTKICITIDPNGSLDSNSTIYTRFRINSLGELFSKQTNKSYFLSSKKECDLYIDFKVNSPRSLPEKITTKMQSQKFGRIKFFLLTESDKNLLYNTGKLHKTRLLEKHIWDSYLAVNNSTGKNKIKRSDEKKIAYHWNHEFKEDGEHDYSLFVKISYASTNWKTIIIALIVIFAMSLFSNFIYDYLINLNEASSSTSKTNTIKLDPSLSPERTNS